MPFALLIVGVIFLLIAYQGTQSQFFMLLKGDFTGTGNFVYWIVSILVIGAIGYVPKLKSISDAFLVLVLVVLFISHSGFFAQFNTQIKASTSTGSIETPTTQPVTSSTNTAMPLTTGQVNTLNSANSLSLF